MQSIPGTTQVVDPHTIKLAFQFKITIFLNDRVQEKVMITVLEIKLSPLDCIMRGMVQPLKSLALIF